MMKRIWFLLAAIIAVMLWAAPGARADWSVGDTASFYYYDFHFFTRYVKTPMTLQGIGDHCYVWTQDSCWALGREGNTIVEPDSVKITDDDIAAIITAFDDETPAADPSGEGILSQTDGIFDKVTGLFGSPPDIDGDPRIHIYIIDCTEGIGYAAMQGYFDPINQLTKIENPYSNQHECFYIDCLSYDPGDPSGGLQSLAQQFTHLVQYRANPGADCWITDGLANFSEFVCGYGVANEQKYSRNFLLIYLQSPITNCREQPEAQDQAKTTMFMQYIFEHYGIEVIQTLAADAQHSGREAVTAALAAHGHSEVDFDSLFFDEQMAWFMDDSTFADGSKFFDGKYSFKYYYSGALLDAKTFETWCNLDYPPYPYIGNQWSTDWILANPPSPCLGDTIVFKGDVGHNFRVTVLKANLGWNQVFDADSFVSLESIPLDDRNRGVIDVSGYGDDYQMVYTSIMHKEAKDGGLSSRTYFVVHNDLTAPDQLHLAVIQNALASKFLNIYVACNESLFVDSYLDQRPLLEIVKGSGAEAVTDTLLEVDKFLTISGDESSTWENTTIYLKQYSLTSEGDFRVVAKGWDMAGNEAPSDEMAGVVKIVGTNRGATLASQDKRACLAIPAGALTKETYVTLFPAEPFPLGRTAGSKAGVLSALGFGSPRSGEAFIGPAIQFGPSGENLVRAARLTLRYSEDELSGLDESQLSICRLESGEWIPVESANNSLLNEISADVDRLGQYRIVADKHVNGGLVPQVFALEQNYPNPFNPSTDISYQIPSEATRAAIHTTLKVYNILGQEIRTLVDQVMSPGYYTVTWDGQDDQGHRAASGVYFYRIVAGQFEDARRMVLLK